MGGEMIFEHSDGQPIGSQTPLYQSILDDIKKATTHLNPPDPSSSDLRDVELEHYELCLDLGETHFIIFPKDPDTHKVRSWMHARKMPYSSKALLHPFLERLSRTFTCFSLYYGDGYDGYNMRDEFYNSSYYSDDNWNPDFTACSSDDCGMCGNCDY